MEIHTLPWELGAWKKMFLVWLNWTQSFALKDWSVVGRIWMFCWPCTFTCTRPFVCKVSLPSCLSIEIFMKDMCTCTLILLEILLLFLLTFLLKNIIWNLKKCYFILENPDLLWKADIKQSGTIVTRDKSAKKFTLVTPPFCCKSLNMSYEIRLILW